MMVGIGLRNKKLAFGDSEIFFTEIRKVAQDSAADLCGDVSAYRTARSVSASSGVFRCGTTSRCSSAGNSYGRPM